jgi:CO/xanthine dehydrogenase Mo-binding subunit
MNDLPQALVTNPNLSDWVKFDKVGMVVRVHTGKVELGQGITTAIALIAAEELDLRLDQVEVLTGSTNSGPNELMTVGSMSIEGSGGAVRQVTAELRLLLLQRASVVLDADIINLKVEEGLVKDSRSNRSISYWDLNTNFEGLIVTGEVSVKPPSQYQLVGGTTTRLDLTKKVSGGVAFLQDEITTETL